MQCEQFDHRLNRLLDLRRLPESDAQLRAHAETCEDCRQLLATQEALFDGLEHSSLHFQLPDSFTENVLQAYHTPQQRGTHQRLAWGALATISLSLTMLLVIPGWLSQSPTLPERNERAENRPAATSHADGKLTFWFLGNSLKADRKEISRMIGKQREQVGVITDTLAPYANSFNLALELLRSSFSS